MEQKWAGFFFSFFYIPGADATKPSSAYQQNIRKNTVWIIETIELFNTGDECLTVIFSFLHAFDNIVGANSKIFPLSFVTLPAFSCIFVAHSSQSLRKLLLRSTYGVAFRVQSLRRSLLPAGLVFWRIPRQSRFICSTEHPDTRNHERGSIKRMQTYVWRIDGGSVSLLVTDFVHVIGLQWGSPRA